jgi:hypothetical protein
VSAPMYIGSYRVERMLGTGSFATVWLAHDERLDAPVAIKVLADNWARHPEIRRRFIDEARLLRRLDDEHVVAVYSIDELPDDRPYFVMGWATAASSGVGPPSGPPPVASLWLKRCRSPSTSPRAWPWSTPSGSSTAMSSPATCCSALCRFTDVSRAAPSGCSSETSAGAGVGRHRHPGRPVRHRRGPLRAAGRPPRLRHRDARSSPDRPTSPSTPRSHPHRRPFRARSGDRPGAVGRSCRSLRHCAADGGGSAPSRPRSKSCCRAPRPRR